LAIGRKGERGGDAKVGEARGAVAGDEHVVGLDVAVQHELLRADTAVHLSTEKAM
jgi:hypothetical protein